MKAVIWDRDARQEADDAVAGSRTPVELQRAIDDALHDITNGRVTHARIGRTQQRRCILTPYPYSIIYVDEDDAIRLLAFPHHKRRTNYWKNRLPKT